MKIGVHNRKIIFYLAHAVDQDRKKPISFILRLNNRRKMTINAATSSMTIPTINLNSYFPSKPFGVRTIRIIPITTETIIAKNMEIAAIAWGIAWTRTNQRMPSPRAISMLSLIVSYVFKNLHFYDKFAFYINLSLRLSSVGAQKPPNL